MFRPILQGIAILDSPPAPRLTVMCCPNCGTQPQLPEQRFCKTCGTNLALVSQILATPPGMSGQTAPRIPPTTGQLPPAYLPGFQEIAAENAKREKLRRLGWITMGGGIVLGIILAIVGGAIRHIVPPVGRMIEELGGFGGLIFFMGLMIVFYARFILKKTDMPQVVFVQPPVVQPPSAQANLTGGLPRMDQAQLPPPLVYGPPYSVTEHTTDRLRVPFPVNPEQQR